MMEALVPYLILLLVIYALGVIWVTVVLLLIPGPFLEALHAGVHWPGYVFKFICSAMRE